MPAVRTPEASRPTRHVAVPRCSLPRRGIGSATSITFDFAALPCGSGLTIRSLAFRPATFLSTLRSGCYQTPRKTRYTAAWLRLCRGRHFRRLNSTRLQGANRVTGSGRPPPVPTERGVRFLLRCTFGVPHHALRQVVHSTFAAIRSKSVSMVSLILSLHRGLSLPLNGAHVAQERVTCR